MLARRITAALERALIGVATVALQKELLVFAPANAANGIGMTSHGT
jgi:hypothetical protein